MPSFKIPNNKKGGFDDMYFIICYLLFPLYYKNFPHINGEKITSVNIHTHTTKILPLIFSYSYSIKYLTIYPSLFPFNNPSYFVCFSKQVVVIFRLSLKHFSIQHACHIYIFIHTHTNTYLVREGERAKGGGERIFF